jgi:hypothetical protein
LNQGSKTGLAKAATLKEKETALKQQRKAEMVKFEVLLYAVPSTGRGVAKKVKKNYFTSGGLFEFSGSPD